MATSSLQHRNPPQQPLTFDQTPESLLQLTQAAIDRARAANNEICSTIKPEQATFHTVLSPLILTANEVATISQYIRLLEGASPSPETRAAASECTKLLNEYTTETSMRDDVFYLVQAVIRNDPVLDPEDQRLLEKTYEAFLRTGFGIQDEGKRERIKEVKIEVDECIRVFMKNLGERDEEVWFSVEELDGVDVATIEGLEASADGCERRLTFRAPDVKAVLKSANAEETRKRVYMGDENVAKANVAVFKECVVLRDELARLLGHANFVEYAFQERMAKSKEDVEAFLDDLHDGLKEGAVEHMNRLQAMKSQDLYLQKANTDKLYIWDVAYYNEKLMKESYKVDQAKIGEYFPAQFAIRGMLDTFEKLFGIVILEEHLDSDSNLIWHPDVRMFSVWDNEAEGGAFNGYLYTDIYPRKGKYGHNANFNINPVSFVLGPRCCHPARELRILM